MRYKINKNMNEFYLDLYNEIQIRKGEKEEKHYDETKCRYLLESIKKLTDRVGGQDLLKNCEYFSTQGKSKILPIHLQVFLNVMHCKHGTGGELNLYTKLRSDNITYEEYISLQTTLINEYDTWFDNLEFPDEENYDKESVSRIKGQLDIEFEDTPKEEIYINIAEYEIAYHENGNEIELHSAQYLKTKADLRYFQYLTRNEMEQQRYFKNILRVFDKENKKFGKGEIHLYDGLILVSMDLIVDNYDGLNAMPIHISNQSKSMLCEEVTTQEKIALIATHGVSEKTNFEDLYKVYKKQKKIYAVDPIHLMNQNQNIELFCVLSQVIADNKIIISKENYIKIINMILDDIGDYEMLVFIEDMKVLISEENLENNIDELKDIYKYIYRELLDIFRSIN